MVEHTVQGQPESAQDRDYLESLVKENKAATFLGHQVRTLQKWRLSGVGPVFVRISRRSVRYRRRELIAWVNARLRQSTSDIGSAQ